MSIDALTKHCDLNCLGTTLYRDLLVIQTLFLQQKGMYELKKRSVIDRVVSIHQPHVRPIVRGKAGAATEF